MLYAAHKKNKNKSSHMDTLFVFFDLETKLCSSGSPIPGVAQFENVENDANFSVHVPNMCVAQQACFLCTDHDDLSQDCAYCGQREFVFADEPIREFMDFLLLDRPKFKSIVVLSHYGSAFDMQFVFKYLVEMKKYRVKPSVIMRGSKIITMKFLHLKFLDSFNYFHLPLSSLPKAYGFEDVSKGYFPHLFNTEENKNYVGPMPEIESYGPDTMKSAEREKFVQWYDEMVAKNYKFDFQKELVDYCKQDVAILRKACLLFRDGFIQQCETCPFTECTTIASTCMRVFRKKYLKENTIGVIPRNGYRMADRQSLKALKWICWMEKVLNRKIQSAFRGREVRLPEGWKVDGVCSSREGKQQTIILNFHGDYWHGCPQCFRFNRDAKTSGGQETLNDKYERTLRISKRIRDAGYNLIEIWECQFDRQVAENAEMREFVESIEMLKKSPLDPRDSFYGGRVENTVKFLKRDCKYYDVRSLYPYICKMGSYPIGHPTVYVGEECQEITGPSKTDLTRVQGLIKCCILPPRNLYHPVLPMRTNEKLLFTLCQACTDRNSKIDCPHDDEAKRAFVGTWVVDEVKVAVQYGYRILEIFEIWQYQMTKYDPHTKQGGLFAEYISEFYKSKLAASGLPLGCETDAQIDAYIDEIERKEGLKLQKSEISHNPSKRFIAKMSNNTLWGKFGQNENLGKTEVINDPQRLFEMLINPEIEVNSWLPVNDDVIYLGWTHKRELNNPSGLTSTVIAAYTTAQARLKLLSYLMPLGERCAYLDTDSIIFYSTGVTGEYEPPLGPLLGDLADELADYGPGARIVEIVSGGPKFYCLKIEKANGEVVYVCKVKGVRLNHKTSTLINFNTVKRMVCGTDDLGSVLIDSYNIRRTAHHDVIGLTEKKICKPVYTKRRFVDLDRSYPFGYKRHCQ